eukprot:366017-Chlamydomonas_euryale.AAC.15
MRERSNIDCDAAMPPSRSLQCEGLCALCARQLRQRTRSSLACTNRWTSRSGAGQSVSLDFIVDLPRSKRGHTAVLVIVDRLTKRVALEPTTTHVTAEETAYLIMKACLSLGMGLPSEIHEYFIPSSAGRPDRADEPDLGRHAQVLRLSVSDRLGQLSTDSLPCQLRSACNRLNSDRLQLSTKIDEQRGARRAIRYVGPFEINKMVSEGVAYQLALPNEYLAMHNVVYVGHLKEYHDGSEKFPWWPQYAPPPAVQVVDNQTVERFMGFEYDKKGQLAHHLGGLRVLSLAGACSCKNKLRLRIAIASLLQEHLKGECKKFCAAYAKETNKVLPDIKKTASNKGVKKIKKVRFA